MLRRLMASQGLAGPNPEFLIRWSWLPRCYQDESANDLAVFLVWDADHGGYFDGWVSS